VLAVRFRAFGSGKSLAKKASPQPAKIELFTRFVESGRKTQTGSGELLGALTGKLSFESGSPVFQCDPSALTQLNDDYIQAVTDTKDQTPPRAHRALSLSLSASDFTGFDAEAEQPRFLLPVDDAVHSKLEVLAELTVAGQVEAAREMNDIFDVPVEPAFAFPLAQQKQQTLTDIGDPAGPILLASNDPSFVPGEGSIRDKIKAQNAKRAQDSSPSTNPGGNFIPFRIVSSAKRPQFTFDHGFLDDGNHGIDESKRESPTLKDLQQLAKWRLMLNGAETFRPDLLDATKAYRHFLDAAGTDLTLSYERFAKSDRTGAHIVENAIDDVRSAAIELNDPRGGNHFVIQSDAIPVGATDENGLLINPRYGYPGTENWQKAIGAHVVWLEGDVTTGIDAKTKTQSFVIEMTLHAEDRYNFNPQNLDIATGIADAENGRFEITGLGKEFTTLATLKRTIRFSLPSGALDVRAIPPGQVVSGPNRN